MTVIHLAAKHLPATIIRGHRGKIFAVVTETLTIPSDASGLRDVYQAIDLATGEISEAPFAASAPWDNERHETRIKIAPGKVIVARRKEGDVSSPLRIYIHPSTAIKLREDK